MKVQSSDKKRCLIALKYTKPQQFKTILALKNLLRNIAISIKDKEVMVQKTAFTPLPQSILRELRIPIGIAHIIIIKKLVQKALIV